MKFCWPVVKLICVPVRALKFPLLVIPLLVFVAVKENVQPLAVKLPELVI